MTLQQRNIVITGAQIALAAVFLVSVSIAVRVRGLEGVPGGDEALPILLSALLLSLSGFIGLQVVRYLFARSVSPEIYFFLLFLFSVGMGGVKALAWYAHRTGGPLFLQVFAVRILYWSYFFALASLGAASLYALGFPYPRVGRLSLGIGLAGALLAWTLPLSNTHFLAYAGLFPPLDLPSYGLLVGMLTMGTLAGFLTAYLVHAPRPLLQGTTGAFSMVAGYTVVFYGWFEEGGLLLGLFFLITGMVLYGREHYRVTVTGAPRL
ncbi:hypothetical protein Spith_0027 [Spirochaeta thermophila DSM 6578]|uniref:Uncharacterized protein n=1 Tax=Winmispira thermophila (strain ATCC 700085 / DSM 6578 / Z-1203) TaxID=869211 RepID=G0GBF5_WINT7|nr:hypothetical protein [Spirochaeta thermophila]AEJ60314.1 hypothetical protein Spith_0027 [Spirochaeta thermophila DSM 6578]